MSLSIRSRSSISRFTERHGENTMRIAAASGSENVIDHLKHPNWGVGLKVVGSCQNDIEVI